MNQGVTQMGIPFEKGKAYKISFKAKALAPKKINAQVGELLVTILGLLTLNLVKQFTLILLLNGQNIHMSLL